MANGTIIIAEDEQVSVGAIERYLERRGYLVFHYMNSRRLRDDINNDMRYHLLITDLSLPEVSGDELILLSKQLHPQIPVISMSGYDAKPKKSDVHLVKPISLDDLEEKIAGYLPMEK